MSEDKIDRKLLRESIKDFKFHFDKEDNTRIIFSAPFGTGKTTFLKEFFNEEKGFIAIRLFPVNYSVTSNEDIFQLIKHDILFQLLGSGLDFETIQFTRLETLGAYLPNKMEKILGKLLSFIPKTGNQLVDNIEPLFNVVKNYNEFHNKIKDKVIDKEIKDFLKQFTLEKGNIFEEDFITLLIQDLLAQHPKTVLVIDDLDRLDPEHVFRIMNIFSAHFDHYGNENKFGFSKIILVCDIENIRTLFKHKYGGNIDFSGYIDKFYSKEVYHFTNHYSLIGWLNGATRSVTPSHQAVISRTDIDFVFDVLSSLIKEGKINFRSLNKLDYNNLDETFQKIYENTTEKRFFDFHLIKVGHLLKALFGDFNSMIEKINEMSSVQTHESHPSIWKEYDKANKFYNYYIFPVLTYNENQFGKIKELEYPYDSKKPIMIKMIIEENGQYIQTRTLVPFGGANKNFWIDLGRVLSILSNYKAI